LPTPDRHDGGQTLKAEWAFSVNLTDSTSPCRIIHEQLGKLSSSGVTPFRLHAIKLLVDAATARIPITQLAQSAVALLRLHEFVKELSHFAFRCH
jgi:hypothetical protein